MGDKEDLTRIEDLSEYLHEVDGDTDPALKINEELNHSKTSISELPDIPAHNENDDRSDPIIPSMDNIDEASDDETFGDILDDDDIDGESFSVLDIKDDDLNLENHFGSEENKEIKIDSIEQIQPEDITDNNDIIEPVELGSEPSFSDIDYDKNAHQEEFEPVSIQVTANEPIFEEEKIIAPVKAPTQEDFADLKSFAQNISYGNISSGGNPPYSIILSNITYTDEAQEIIDILKEHKIINDSNEAVMKKGVETGSLLISQINEFSAIFLAHKLRRFNVKIKMGLSDEIRPSKSTSKFRGLVSKNNILQNKTSHMNLQNKDLSVDSILISTTSSLEGYQILQYLDIVTEHIVITENELINLSKSRHQHSDNVDYIDMSSEEINPDAISGLSSIYQYLAHKLKQRALAMNANGIIGINFTFSPLLNTNRQIENDIKYKITCAGNAVLLNNFEYDNN